MNADWYAIQAADAESKAEIARQRGWADLARKFEALAERAKREGYEATTKEPGAWMQRKNGEAL